MSKVADYVQAVYDRVSNNKLRVAMALVALADVLGYKVDVANMQVYVTLGVYVLFLVEEASRLAIKAKPPSTVSVTGPVPAAPAAPAPPPAPVP